MADASTTPAHTGWEAEKARLETQLKEAQQQLSGLSAERNQYRQKADAWEKQVGGALGEMVKLDPTTGLPIGVDAGSSAPAATGHPLTGVIDNPQAVDQYYTQLMNQQGFLTQAQTQQYWQQREHALRTEFLGNLQLFRTLDKTLARKEYADLNEYKDGAWSKKTAEVLQEKGWGKPLDGAQSWDQWQYATPDAFVTAADIAQARLFKEQQGQQASQQQAQANQASVGLSVGSPGATPSPPRGDEVPLTKDGGVDFDRLRADTQQRVESLGIRV